MMVTRPDLTNPYPKDVDAFADALEDIMASHTHDLDGIVSALNNRGISLWGDSSWTNERLQAALADLADAPQRARS